MNEQFPKTEVAPTIKEKIEQFTQLFLGDEIEYFDSKFLSQIKSESESEISRKSENLKQTKEKSVVEYDSHTKEFWIKKGEEIEKRISVGNIVSSQRWGADLFLPKELDNFTKTADIKNIEKIKNLVLESQIRNRLVGSLNKELAKKIAENMKHKDAFKAVAYESIAERYDVKNEQLGVMAEQVIMGVLEGMAIDRPDLGFSVLEANAYQDVQNKIDFIISTKQKRRGVGIDRNEVTFEEKSIGIQFTTNTTKAEHKAEQIIKAKKRGVEVDDIIYVELDSRILSPAVKRWEDAGKPVAGPWKFLPPEIRIQVVTNLFKGILSEEQIKSLLKNLK